MVFIIVYYVPRYSLSFCLPEFIFSLPSFVKGSFAGYNILVWQSLLSALWVHHPTASWTSLFAMRSQPVILLGFPYTWWVIFLLQFARFSLLLAFNIFTVMYLTMDLIEFILFGNHWASYMYRFMFIIKLSNFLPLFFFFSLCFSLPSFWYFNYIYVGALKSIPNVSKIMFIFLHPIFSLFFVSCNLCWSFFKIPESSFCQFKCIVEAFYC